MLLISQTHDLLVANGYKLIDDAWRKFGRRTYLHDDDCDRNYTKGLAKLLHTSGWQSDTAKLRTFCHPAHHHEIELEPGGAEVTGHFLHHIKPKRT
jgi:hypothetical protein